MIKVLTDSLIQQISAVQQPTQSCPAICTKLCAPDCPVRCCNLPPPVASAPNPPPAPMYCPQICYSMCISSCPGDCCSSTRPGVNRNSVSYTVSLPCPANCYSDCDASCPSQCCQASSTRSSPMSSSPLKRIGEGNIRALLKENEAPVTRISTPSVSNIMVRSKLLCPDVCSKERSWRCPKECCSERKHESIENEDNWSPTPPGNFFVCWLIDWLAIFVLYNLGTFIDLYPQKII